MQSKWVLLLTSELGNVTRTEFNLVFMIKDYTLYFDIKLYCGQFSHTRLIFSHLFMKKIPYFKDMSIEDDTSNIMDLTFTI